MSQFWHHDGIGENLCAYWPPSLWGGSDGPLATREKPQRSCESIHLPPLFPQSRLAPAAAVARATVTWPAEGSAHLAGPSPSWSEPQTHTPHSSCQGRPSAGRSPASLPAAPGSRSAAPPARNWTQCNPELRSSGWSGRGCQQDLGFQCSFRDGGTCWEIGRMHRLHAKTAGDKCRAGNITLMKRIGLLYTYYFQFFLQFVPNRLNFLPTPPHQRK